MAFSRGAGCRAGASGDLLPPERFGAAPARFPNAKSHQYPRPQESPKSLRRRRLQSKESLSGIGLPGWAALWAAPIRGGMLPRFPIPFQHGGPPWHWTLRWLCVLSVSAVNGLPCLAPASPRLGSGLIHLLSLIHISEPTRPY